MSVKYSFTDNVSYGTEDINAITMDLTGAGIAPFTEQTMYSTSDLNSVTEALVSVGEGLGGCKCTRTDTTLNVAQGTIFFENGVRMSVGGDGHSIPITENTAAYIFAYFNTSLQSGGIRFDTVLPENELYVLLAEISEDGTLTDRRSFARSKVATFGANAVYDAEFVNVDEIVYEGTVNNNEKIFVTKKLDGVDISVFNYGIFEMHNTRGVFDLNTGKFVIQYVLDEHGNASDAYCGGVNLMNFYNYPTVAIEKRDNTLVAVQPGAFDGDYYKSYKIKVKLI